MNQILLTVVLLLAVAAARAEVPPTPANFGSGEKSLAELIEFPELRGDTSVAISCAGILEGKGKFDEHGCYRVNPGDDTFIAQIYDVIRKARLTPATWNGQNVDVVFQYRVQFTKKGEEETLRFVANTGYEENVVAYGVEHIGAQRLWGKETWQSSCPRQAKFVVLARANVDFDGTPAAVSLEHVTGIPITAKCSGAIEQTILDSRFIPARADGEFVPSTYVEPFGN